MTEQKKTDALIEPEELWYEFYVSTLKAGSQETEAIDLIAEGWVDSLEEWNSMVKYLQDDVLQDVLDDFVADRTESGWIKLDD